MRRDRDAPQADGAFFDARRAKRAVQWIEKFCRHSKGEFAGRPLILSPFQSAWIGDLWGWRRESDGTRLYRRTFQALPRKNGKTTSCAAIALALTAGDGEPGAEVYSIAGNKEQARIVFDEARKMVGQSPDLDATFESLAHSLYCPPLRSVFRPLAAKGDTQHGLNPHGVIGDEVHSWKGRKQYEAMRTAQGTRRQPLEVYITTAGDDMSSVCWELWQYAIQVRDGVFDAPEFLPVLYAADADDDWTNPAVWAMANPNLGVSVKLDFLQSECLEAQRNPALENTFKRLYLNLWTEQAERWIATQVWTAPANAATFCEDALVGRPCVMGVDLAQTRDMCAIVLVFPPSAGDESWRTVCRYFMPAEGLATRVQKEFTPYDVWSREGWLTLTEGNVMDYRVYEAEVRRLHEKFSPSEVAYDRMFAGELVNNLMDDGVSVIAVGQGALSLATPCLEFERSLMAGKFGHGGHPILAWNAANVGVVRDQNGKPLKPKRGGPNKPHDGVSAILTAMARVLAGAQPGSGSMYDDPDFVARLAQHV